MPLTVTANDLQERIESLFNMLIEFPIDISETNAPNSDAVFYAFYGRGEVDSAFIIDLSLANALGAALPRIHPSVASDATKDLQVPENIKENLYEILNVATCLLRLDHKQRVEMKETFGPGDDVPEAYMEATKGDQMAFKVKFGPYEEGTFRVCFPQN